jgi:ABC-type multidrug transport system permease subunit
MFSALFSFPPEKVRGTFRARARLALHAHAYARLAGGAQAITIKERRSGWFRLSSYYVARCIADLPLDIIVPFFFVLILYWMAALRAAVFILHLLAVLLAVLVATSIGLLLSAIVMELKQAQSLASVSTLVLMLTGGFYIQKCVFLCVCDA